ncbi:MAG: cell envelope integrity EipB family protein [Cohaesibacter sp.]|nr:cell envelope integrity EipB family protein [Cohaesibacter sp.]
MLTAKGVQPVKKLIVALGLVVFVGNSFHALNGALSVLAADVKPAPVGDLAPLSSFRAVYDITLAQGGNRAGVSSMDGRMVYELNGSACDGYALTHRFVTRVDLSEGQGSLTDLRAASFENPQDRSFQFIIQTFVDQELRQISRGVAIHDTDLSYVVLSEPEEKTMELGRDALFPVEYIVALLKAASSGERFFKAAIYDGSETGEVVLDSTALIGVAKSNGNAAFAYPSLSGLRHWPVTIAYFERGKDKDEMVPIYEISMDLYENGVSAGIEIKYPDFSLTGSLSGLSILENETCDLVEKKGKNKE